MSTLNKEIILKTLTKNKKEIKKFGVKRLVLFGSYARDEQKKTSDIDFLVEFKKNRSDEIQDYLDLLHFLEDLFNKKIDLVKPHLVRDFLKPYILEGVQYEASI